MHAAGLSLGGGRQQEDANGSVLDADGRECGVIASHGVGKTRTVGNGQHVDVLAWTVGLGFASIDFPAVLNAGRVDTTCSRATCRDSGCSRERAMRAFAYACRSATCSRSLTTSSAIRP